MKFLPVSAALLLAATAFATQAQTAAAPKTVSKDELRTCMKTEADLAASRTAIAARSEANRAEMAAIKVQAEEMTAEQKAVEGNEANIFVGTDHMGSGDEGSHTAGVVVGPRRSGERVVHPRKAQQ